MARKPAKRARNKIVPALPELATAAKIARDLKEKAQTAHVMADKMHKRAHRLHMKAMKDLAGDGG